MYIPALYPWFVPRLRWLLLYMFANYELLFAFHQSTRVFTYIYLYNVQRVERVMCTYYTKSGVYLQNPGKNLRKTRPVEE